MRRRGGWLLAVATVVALAGCGQQAGTDGDLTNTWPVMPKAVTPVPVTGTCYTTPLDETWYGDFATAVDCGIGDHQTETVYVGTFTGADADRSAPPIGGSAARRGAYDLCQSKANDFLGAQWQGARVDLGLVLPDDKAWTGGARWYRCDLVKYKDSNYDLVDTLGSAKDGLRGAKPLGYGCMTLTDDGTGRVKTAVDTPCNQPHNAEFDGLYTAPDAAWQSNDTTRRNTERDDCFKALSKFLGYGSADYGSRYIYSWPWGFDQSQWQLGDRTERCFAVAVDGKGSVNGVRVQGSMAGLKGAAPKRV